LASNTFALTPSPRKIKISVPTNSPTSRWSIPNDFSCSLSTQVERRRLSGCARV
jgi:hypothetical protein